MVKVKKRDGSVEEFVESKIVAGVRKAGATAKEAEQVAKEVSKTVARRTEVAAADLSKMVVTSLEKVNKAAAAEFTRFRDSKLKTQKKK